MWFRSSGSGNVAGDAAAATTAAVNTTANPTSETSKFEKFRRASFRRKSTGQAPNRKRSKSPHFILQTEKTASSLAEAANEDEENEQQEERRQMTKVHIDMIGESHENTINCDIAIYKNEVNIPLKSPVPLSDPKLKAPTKKTTLKAIKTEPPKRKFYKNFTTTTTTRQKSHEGVAVTHNKIDAIQEQLNDEDDDDDYDDDSEDDTDDDNNDKDNLPLQGKKKILLTDPKFKHNRIEKSSSKTKIVDVERRESIKRSRSSRKISAPPILMDDTSKSKQKKDKSIVDNAEANVADTGKTRARAYSHLNLQALVKFVVNNKKFLNTDDFALIRRKSISEAASAVIAVAASSSSVKPMPIALKYSQDGVVAEAPNEQDTKAAERNVVLVKKQNLKNSFCERLNNNNLEENNKDINAKLSKALSKEKTVKISTKVKNNKNAGVTTVKRNSSNSSKSSGNFEDEAFYSCDEQESERIKNIGTNGIETNEVPQDAEQPKRKSSSPSLTSRVAAKINETTNNYKNRKAAKSAKKRKTVATIIAVGGKRPEYYKQLSVERLSSTSIVRQPSDRRPDAGNISLRSNGNASHNTSDLQSSFHASASGADTSAAAAAESTHAAAGATGGAAGSATTTSGAAADTNAQDAEGKDARRERLHQQHQQNKSAPVSVNRSESYKERLSHKRNRNSRRKTSDPSLTSRPNDDQPDLGLSNSNYTASSNSSLSSGGGSESPSTSMEQVGGAAAAAASSVTHQHHHAASHHGPHHTHQHSHQDSFHGSSGSGSNTNSFWGGSIGGPGGPTIGQLARQWNFESDEEEDLNEADWSSNVASDMLAVLNDAEKKRQEIINEIYQTERSHVRTLKLLERLFFGPLQESGVLSQDHLFLLFPPALLSLRELHSAFEQQIKQRRVEHNHIVNHIGDLLASMFDGQSGDELREYAAQFCARQQIALEALKEKRRKDEQLQKILSKAESHKACRRLQLKDLLPTVLQRLTKYPLLFENLYKVTIRVVPENTLEAEAIQRALESSKKILVDVNQAVKTAEDAHKLQNIQRKLDKSTFDKDEFKNLDLTQYRLIHDGSLTMKKNPSIQLHGLLFENMIVLLTKQDDKYSLKYLHAARNTEVNNKPVSPIMNIDSETLVRQEAADKNSFFLIKTKTSQMLELRAPSSSECKTWFKHISDAAEQYKPRSKNANNHEPVDDPAIATIPHSNTKESLELTPERPPPLSATATVITTPLAPMMALPTAHATATAHINDVQLRGANGRREVPPSSAADHHKQRLSHNELQPGSVSRTMSTRSCGEAINNYGAADSVNGVTLRHTQSARQANAAAGGEPDITENTTGSAASAGNASNRNSTSIVYSNNSNNTRTLMQSSPPLVEPTAIQISISTAVTAEPVLTPAERLRRLDASIRDGLLEKQKIICDMFRLPVEHFHEIVDIAAMPEAPKDSVDIALAAYAQVQSLTEVVNDYMHVTPEQEISAVSTAVCDQCHEKQRQRPLTPNTPSSSSSSASAKTQVARGDTPPPLPPPNKQKAQAQQLKPLPVPVTKLQTPAVASILDEDDALIHEDDDGYCEIDELRLPSLSSTAASLNSAKSTKSGSPPPPLPPPVGSFKTPPVPPPPPTVTLTTATAATPELVKRQSTISADSIPEESADEVTQAMGDEHQHAATVAKESSTECDHSHTVVAASVNNDDQSEEKCAPETLHKENEETALAVANKIHDEILNVATIEKVESVEVVENIATSTLTTTPTIGAEPQTQSNATVAKSDEPILSLNIAHEEINEAYDTLTTLSKLNAVMVDGMTQTIFGATAINATLLLPSPCGTNRIQHANSLEPSVPCHALNSIVSALNAQISLLLPKINERDMERERLRKENQHLRELLNAMHERQRVEDNLETPTDIRASANDNDDDAEVEDEIDGSTTSTTPTPAPTTTAVSTAAAAAATTTTTNTPSTTTVEAEN